MLRGKERYTAVKMAGLSIVEKEVACSQRTTACDDTPSGVRLSEDEREI